MEMGVLAKLVEDTLDAGSCVLVRGIVPDADAEGTALFAGGGVGELTGGATCELAGGGGD